MNKNWLYRVLAMALIVMMALPFAMAEEVEVQTNAVEEAVASEDFDIGGTTEAVEVTEVAANTPEWDAAVIEWGELKDIGEWDIAELGDTVFVQLDEEDADEYKITSYKSSKTKYAKISKVDKKAGVFKITFKDPGTVKFTVKYKYMEEDEDHYDHSGTATAEIEVKDSNTIDNVYLFFGDGEDLTSEDDRIDENPFEVKFGKYEDVSVIPFAVNDDGDVLDYNQGEDVDPEDYEENSSKRASNWDKYTFKWSNTSVACFEDEDGKKVNNKTKTTEEISELTPVFYKPGKSKLTVTSKYDKKKKCTVTFKVTGFDALPTGKKPSAPADTVYFRVKSAKYTSYKEAEVVLYIVNGGKAKLHKSPVDVAIVDEKGTTVFEKDSVSFPTLAGGKSTTLKITFKSDDKHDEIQEYQDLRYLRLDDESTGLDDYIGNYGVISNEAK